MKRWLPLLVIFLALLIPLLIFLNIRIQKEITQKTPKSYPSEPIPVSVEDTKRIMEGEDIVQSKDSNLVSKPILKIARGFYKSFSNNQLAVDTGSSTISTLVTPELYTVCIPQYWYDNAGNRYDVTKTWVDYSAVTLESYRSLGPNERLVQFATVQPKLDTKSHLIVLTQEIPSEKLFVAKKVWIVGC